MKQNLGSVDRLVRVVVGVAILSLFFVFPESQWRWAALIGIVPIFTAIMGNCMLYSMLGISTCKCSTDNRD
ncbi:DUF2892 domain-containing protein [Phaeovibrio sulfidiphilus]|uniref:DUF2892 domain-containing protein n=1 Tax=Phaeovibrio sulfidiphilus TaxID=1220600 RepID=A0A8J6YMR6_9PROT|nr:DUF2892 domain-containing protein [Phaeovibrio sulfidiphilus]MBE1236176.1 DUF2892 domain-containing protein [Phaeovibrio sulfidiphilus]